MEYKFSNRVQSLKGSAIREIFKMLGDPTVISFAGGNPAPEYFPAKEFERLAEVMLSNNPTQALQYSVTEGYPRLIEQVKNRYAELFHENDDAIIVSGGQQGIALATKSILNEGDVVICEEPSFIGGLNVFRSYGARLVGVPVEDDGMNLNKLEDALKSNKNAKLIYTIPTFQNPSGVTMSQEKREQILALAEKYDVLIIEDNPYGELAFGGEHYRPIKELDREGRVIYCGSFSKILAPGLRVGFTVANKEILSKMVVCKQVSDVHTNIFCQLLISSYMDNYNLDNHIQKLRGVYKERCEAMLEAMDEYFPRAVRHTVPKGGLFIWCTMDGEMDSQEVAKKCGEKKVVFVPGATFMVDENAPCSSFRCNYSSMNPDKIREGIKILGDALFDIL